MARFTHSAACPSPLAIVQPIASMHVTSILFPIPRLQLRLPCVRDVRVLQPSKRSLRIS
jgi:hypothetical protein